MINSKQEKQYVENQGVRCPHCNSDELDAGEPQADGAEIIVEITCNSCREIWKDLYKLAGIIED